MTQAIHHCKVCELLDGDTTLKATAKYCELCGTFICDDCNGNFLRRGMASAIVAASKKRRQQIAQTRKAKTPKFP